MSVIAFDTLKFVKKPKEAGVSEKQAEAQAEVLAETLESNLEELATKRDLKELQLKMENKFESMQGELKLLKWMMGVILAGVISLVLKAFFI